MKIKTNKNMIIEQNPKTFLHLNFKRINQPIIEKKEMILLSLVSE